MIARCGVLAVIACVGIVGGTDVNGTLYGTTDNGGTNCGSNGCGLVFSMKPSFKVTVLHSFGGPGDGKHPSANLVNVNGTLYGTT